MDNIDIETINILAKDGRVSFSELGSKIGLSAPAAAERVKRLEEKGIIKGYSAILDAEKMGFGLLAFVSLTLAHPKHIKGFLSKIIKLKEI